MERFLVPLTQDTERLHEPFRRIRTLPENIGNYQNLTHIILHNNILRTLPESIGNLRNLKYLILFKNHLRKLPHTVCDLVGLKEMSITSNSISQLPKNIGNMVQLETLSMADNEIVSLPSSLINLENLTYLSVDVEKLNANSLKIIQSMMQRNPGLKVFDKSHQEIVPDHLLQLIIQAQGNYDTEVLRILSTTHPRFRTLPESSLQRTSSFLRGNSRRNPNRVGGKSKKEKRSTRNKKKTKGNTRKR